MIRKLHTYLVAGQCLERLVAGCDLYLPVLGVGLWAYHKVDIASALSSVRHG